MRGSQSVLNDVWIRRMKELVQKNGIFPLSSSSSSSVGSDHYRRAAVLVTLCSRHSTPSLLFTLRTSDVGTHRGQVSFPGGHIESNETAIDAAIRETYEELGSDIGNIDIVGVCQTIPAITGTLVTPVIGFLQNDVGDFEKFNPSIAEVEKIFTRSIDELMQPEYKSVETLQRGGRSVAIPSYGSGKERIWGLTAFILDPILTNLIRPTQHIQ